MPSEMEIARLNQSVEEKLMDELPCLSHVNPFSMGDILPFLRDGVKVIVRLRLFFSISW